MSGVSSLGPRQWIKISNFLSVRDVLNLGAVDRHTQACVTPALADKIQQIKKASDGIFLFPPLDERRLENPAYCRCYLSQMAKRIAPIPCLREVLDARLVDLEAKIAMVQTAKDKDLLTVFEPMLPTEARSQITQKTCISEKAKIVREFLQNHPKHFHSVTVIDLRDKGLTLIPQELIEYCPNLQRLDLSGNQIQFIPDAIGNLVNLQRLDLSGNQIQVIPNAIGNLVNLQELNLSVNQIKVIPNAIGNLVNLQRLCLRLNQIQAIPDVIGNLVNLQELALSCNEIKVIPDVIGNLVNLQGLYLWENQIQVIPDAIEKLVNLKKLHLAQNQIQVIPNAIGNLVNLRELALHDNQIQVIPDAIEKLGSLEFLFLHHNQIKVIPDAIGNLRKLTIGFPKDEATWVFGRIGGPLSQFSHSLPQ